MLHDDQDKHRKIGRLPACKFVSKICLSSNICKDGAAHGEAVCLFVHVVIHTVSSSEMFTWNDRGLDDDHNAILDDIAILLLVRLLYICCVDNLAVAANAHVLVNDTLLHLRVGPCTDIPSDMQPADVALSPISGQGQSALCA